MMTDFWTKKNLFKIGFNSAVRYGDMPHAKERHCFCGSKSTSQVGFSLKFCLGALQRSSDFGSALLKYYVKIQLFNV